MVNTQQFYKKSESDIFDDKSFKFTREELIQIYNALGYTMTNVAMLNGFLQDTDIHYITEENNKFIGAIRYKIEAELSRRNFDEE